MPIQWNGGRDRESQRKNPKREQISQSVNQSTGRKVKHYEMVCNKHNLTRNEFVVTSFS